MRLLRTSEMPLPDRSLVETLDSGAQKLVKFLSQGLRIGVYRDNRYVTTIAMMQDHQAELLARLLTFARDANTSPIFFYDDNRLFALTESTLTQIRDDLKNARRWRVRFMERTDRFHVPQFDDHVELQCDNRVVFEFWHRQDQFLLTENLNLYARKIAVEYAEEHGFLTDRAPVFDFRSLHPHELDSRIEFPVDIVYTWVNHEDPDWQKLFEGETGRPWKESTLKDRYISRNELLYSLRSVALYAPWARNIFVVSNCKPPAWLNVKNSKIRWIDHQQIFEPECLPTFNSHAIESRLHHVPGIAEHFLYFNDDFFLTRAQWPDQYFRSNGVSCSFMENYGVVNGNGLPRSFEYFNAARNGKALIERRFGVSVTQLHQHTPYALKKSVLSEIEKVFSAEMAVTAASKFRNVTDISLPSFLYHHYAYLTRHAVRSRSATSNLIKYTNPNYKARLQKISRLRDVDVICINDGAGSTESPDWNVTVDTFLSTYFRDKSAFEN